MNESGPMTRRAVLAASVGLASYGAAPLNAEMTDEGKEILLAIKRIIDEDLIDQPEKASEILGLQIVDYRGANEDVRPLPVIGTSRARKLFTSLEVSISATDKPQRMNYGKLELSLIDFHAKSSDPVRMTDKEVVEMFGSRFTLASSLVRPVWRPGTDMRDWSGRYPNETFIYEFEKPRKLEMTIKFGSQTQLSRITLRTNRRGDKY